MRRVLFFALALIAIRTLADCRATHPPSQYAVELHGPACTSAAPCVRNHSIHFSVVPANGCYIPFYPGPCPTPYVIDSCDLLTWNFGDGTPPKQVVGTGEVDHVFPMTGNFTINVDIHNGAGSGSIHGSAYICADPPTYLNFSSERYEVAENGGSVTVTLERTGDTSRAFSVDYLTDVTQTSGNFDRNLEMIKETLSFAPGETRKEITHRVQDDNVFLGDVDHSVGVLTNGDVVMSGGPVTTAIIHLFDNEPGPEFTIDDVTIPEGNSARTIDVPLHLSSPAADYVYAWCVPHDGTAHAGTDFVLLGSSAAFNPGETSSKCQVKIIGNNVPEPDKTFTVTTDPVIGPVKVTRGTAVFTLTNDDAKPPLPTQSLSFEPNRLQLTSGAADSVMLYANIAATASLVSSDPSVVDVEASASVPGSVRLVAGKVGTAVITATDGTASATMEVEVAPAPRRRAMR